VTNATALRRRLNMTQQEFAQRFGFPVATLRDWERRYWRRTSTK
jgi:DNA-binding transcriptional regulator YiaG